MEDPKERLTTCVSTTELERRWKAAREMMRRDKVDFLVMRQDEEFLGGYVRWGMLTKILGGIEDEATDTGAKS